MLTTVKHLFDLIFPRPPAIAPPALTARTSPPIPVWEFCRACGSAGVVPAAVLARDPGTSEELRRYAADYMRN